jgi:hypothetical protein
VSADTPRLRCRDSPADEGSAGALCATGNAEAVVAPPASISAFSTCASNKGIFAASPVGDAKSFFEASMSTSARDLERAM